MLSDIEPESVTSPPDAMRSLSTLPVNAIKSELWVPKLAIAPFGFLNKTWVILLAVSAIEQAPIWLPDLVLNCNFAWPNVPSLYAVVPATITAPFDVIKTRIQNRNFGSSDSMIDISKRILLEEGPGGFFKGLNTKLFVIGPKIMFSFSMSQTLISYFEQNYGN